MLISRNFDEQCTKLLKQEGRFVTAYHLCFQPSKYDPIEVESKSERIRIKILSDA